MVEILKVGTSAGGARPKAVIAYNEKTGEVRSGQTNAPKGFEHWLLKLDGVSEVQLGASQGYGRVEMAYYKMAIDSGIRHIDSAELYGRGHAEELIAEAIKDYDRSKLFLVTKVLDNHLAYVDVLASCKASLDRLQTNYLLLV